MTTEERFERIEHVTAALAEERRRDREEYKSLWRDTQRQLNELTATVSALALKVADTNDAIARTNDTIDRLALEMRDADARLGARIETMISAIGQNLSLEHRVASLEAALPKPAHPQA